MVPVGLLFLGLVVRTILGAAIVVAVVWLLFKLAKKSIKTRLKANSITN